MYHVTKRVQPLRNLAQSDPPEADLIGFFVLHQVEIKSIEGGEVNGMIVNVQFPRSCLPERIALTFIDTPNSIPDE
jgi:hypothetical protein